MLKNLGAAVVFASSLAISGLGFAQEPVPELEQVLVYGEKQATSLQDLPASVGFFSGQEIFDSVVFDFNDLYNRTANVNSLRSGNETLFAIRGVSVQGLSDNPVSYTASVYVDDVPMGIESIRYGSMGVWDVQQVEIFRGPQGTLQGRNSLTGAIIVKTNDPTYEWQGNAQGYYGDYDTTRYSIAGGGPLIDDQLAFRLTVDDYRSDGYIHNTTRNEDDYAGFERRTYRGKLLFEPKAVEQLSMLLTSARVDNNMGDNPMARFDDPYSFDAPSDGDSFHDIPTELPSLKASWEFSDQFSMTSVTAYTTDDYKRLDDYDSTALDLGYIDQNNDSQTFSQELRFNFTSGNFTGVGGLYYAKLERSANWVLETFYPKSAVEGSAYQAMYDYGLDQATADFVWMAIPDLIDLGSINNSDYKTENYAAFGEVTWQATVNWSFTLGARYDIEDQDRHQSVENEVATVTGNPLADILLGTLAGGSTEAAKTDYHAFLPKFVTQYYWADNFSTAFSVQRGYRAGGSSVRLLTGEVEDFDPEYTWNYEVALRSVWLDNRLLVNANIFYTDWEDQQVDVSPTGDPRDNFIGNAGQSTLYGAELETSFDLTETVELFANVGYVKTEFDTFTIQGSDGLEDLSGNEFLGAPNWTGTVGAVYRSASGIFISADTSYEGEGYTTNDNDLKTDSRVLVNGKLGYEQEHWAVYLWGSNLFDEKYTTNQWHVDPSVGATQDYVQPGAPRMIGGSVHLVF